MGGLASRRFGYRSGLALMAIMSLLAACGKKDAGSDSNSVVSNLAGTAPAAAPSDTNMATPSVAPVAAGFDPASAPVVNPTLGGFPYVGLLDGYVALNKDNSPAEFDKENQKDANYDRYEFFDGTKLIPVEGRLRTVEAIGKGASIYEAMKNYHKIIQDLGGVTVWEGDGKVMDEKKIDFSERRHRNRYSMLRYEKMGVYMVRTPDKEIWVEVYQTNDEKPDNYWLTIVEKKALQVSAKLLPAEAMKKALDASGHVALYINFDTDKTAIKPDSQPILAEVVKLLNSDPALKLTIEGHTDNAGTPAHNQTLSDGRANAVVGSLMSQGIGADRLQAKGFGQNKPLADNGSEDGRAKNRRVELVKR